MNENGEKKSDNEKIKGKYNIRTIFYHNTFVLIFSFICAIIIWFSVAATNTENNPRLIYDVPVEIQLSDTAKEEGIRIFSQSYNIADVAVTGNNFIVNQLTADDIRVYADLSPASTKLSGNMVASETIKLKVEKKGNTFADYNVSGVAPEEINVLYDRYKEATFQIENNVKVLAADSFYAQTPSLSTEKVVVSGPESSVNKVGRVSLDYNIPDPLSQSRSFTSALTVYDVNNKPMDLSANFITLSADTVDVNITVLSRQTVALDVTTLNVPEGFSANRITIEPESIDIAGSPDVVSQYKSITLPKAIDFTEINLNNCKFDNVEIPMPAGVTNVSNVQNAVISVNLSGFVESTINTTTLNLVNVPEGKTVTLVTKKLPVNIIGSQAQVGRITPSSIYGTIDMATMADQNGNREVPVNVKISGATSCWAYGQYTVQVTVEDKKADEALAESAATPQPSN